MVMTRKDNSRQTREDNLTERPKYTTRTCSYTLGHSPCYLHFCPFGSTCRVNSSTNEPVCVCEQKCPAVLAPLCGSDGATYNNPCLMERASCLRGKKIKVASNGPCDLNFNLVDFDITYGAVINVFHQHLGKCYVPLLGTTSPNRIYRTCLSDALSGGEGLSNFTDWIAPKVMREPDSISSMVKYYKQGDATSTALCWLG
ncbi:agrin [Biomphalaria pfeifferi]|uniref:Agrin n=1 Tax=Biomphalaria pfeifferi TaxID=112525 RepID=A0AAD8BMI6_BIOPF|nr:agrin [Biomphalaria pfeifferi]